MERIDDGEVSPYLHDVVQLKDEIELRGPIGGYFIWDVALGGPLLLVGGGSGVVPLMAMIRHRVAARSSIQTRLLYSVRSPDDVLYATELQTLQDHGEGVDVTYTYTRQAPAGWNGFHRRIDRAMLKEITSQLEAGLRPYVCGPTLLVEAAANNLQELGIPAGRIRTERFGPSGT